MLNLLDPFKHTQVNIRFVFICLLQEHDQYTNLVVTEM